MPGRGLTAAMGRRPSRLPTPRGAHLEMVGAVLAGDGLERVAEIASRPRGAPVAVIVPRLGAPVEAWAPLRALRGRAPGGRPAASGRAEVDRRGADRLRWPGARRGADARAGAARTPASTSTWRRSRRSPRWRWLRRATRPSSRCAARSSRSCCTRDDLDAGRRRAPRAPARLRPVARAHVALCADPGRAQPGGCVAAIAAERPGALAADRGRQRLRTAARRPSEEARARGHPRRAARPPSGISSRYSRPGRPDAARSRRPSWCWA